MLNIFSGRRFILALAFAGFSSNLLAVDGVILIDQNRALAGNVTPGDAPGFPVTISVSGSYRLSGSLTVPDANTTAIELTADFVSLDLNGFSIIGPTVCTGTPVTSCSPTGNGNGIYGAFRTGITITNGTVRGMGGYGVHLDGAGVVSVERVTAQSNAVIGILGGKGLFIDNRVVRNGLRGMQTASDQIVRGNFAYGNAQYGIIANCPGSVINNTAISNGTNLFLNGPGCVAATNAAP
jgi:hypothetical protein